MSVCIKIFVVLEVSNCGIFFFWCFLGSIDDKYYFEKYLLSVYWELIILLGSKDIKLNKMWFLFLVNL